MVEIQTTQSKHFIIYLDYHKGKV